MARAIWSGSISFGLVNIPVKMYSAVMDKTVHFHMLHDKDGVRVRQRLVCPAEDKEVSRDDVVKGYEIEEDQYVVVTQEEFAALAPRASRTIDVQDFVGLDEIDPIYYQHPYYLVPDEKAGKSYGLFVKAIADAGKVGIGKVVMRDKEYLTALRPVGNVLVLETMRFADEVVDASGIEEMPADVPEPTARELEMADQLIGMLTGSFEPAKYHDEYRESLMDLIETKAEGEEYVMPEPVEEEAKVIDLMAALEKSLKKASGARGGKKAAGGRKAAGAGGRAGAKAGAKGRAGAGSKAKAKPAAGARRKSA